MHPVTSSSWIKCLLNIGWFVTFSDDYGVEYSPVSLNEGEEDQQEEEGEEEEEEEEDREGEGTKWGNTERMKLTTRDNFPPYKQI